MKLDTYIGFATLGLIVIFSFLFAGNTQLFGGTVLSTATTDTLETFRTNVNSSLSSINGTFAATTTTNSWSSLQTFTGSASSTLFSANYAQIGGTATTTLTSSGTLGIGSSTPLGNLGIGTGTATSSISGGYFCAYFKDEAGRGMWIKLATSGNTVFATSTSPCNQ